jgi:hypothetical protein
VLETERRSTPGGGKGKAAFRVFGFMTEGIPSPAAPTPSQAALLSLERRDARTQGQRPSQKAPAEARLSKITRPSTQQAFRVSVNEAGSAVTISDGASVALSRRDWRRWWGLGSRKMNSSMSNSFAASLGIPVHPFGSHNGWKRNSFTNRLASAPDWTP